MLAIIGNVIAGLTGAGIFVLGVLYLWAPRLFVGFGIPDMPVTDRAFLALVRVKGDRDIGLGLLVAVLLAAAPAHLLGWFMLAATVMPLCDAAIVLRSGGPRSAAYGVHAATAAVMLVGAILLLLS